MVSKRVIFGAFLFLVSSDFLYFGGVYNKTIIPFALVGYEIGYSRLGPAGLVGCLPSNLRSGVPLLGRLIAGYLPSHIQRVLME